MLPVEIQIAGFGGQGVVLAGMTIGRGLTLYQNCHVSLTQSFGPEARGSSCSVQLVVDQKPILYPYMEAPDILVAMSQEAYHKFSPKLRKGGTLLVEEDLVSLEDVDPSVRVWRVPAVRLAEELRRKMVLNIVMVGAFTALTGLLDPENGRRAVSESVPHGTAALNLAAFDKGFQYGKQLLASQQAA